MTTQHEEITKSRFLDLMVAGLPAKEAVNIAIEDATVFVFTYQQWQQDERNASRGYRKLKGCPVCFGAGGKRMAPCNACGGTGKVPDHRPGEPLL